jgi:hypothetical protein
VARLQETHEKWAATFKQDSGLAGPIWAILCEFFLELLCFAYVQVLSDGTQGMRQFAD